MAEGEDCEETSNSYNRSGSKRVIEEISDELEVNKDGNSEMRRSSDVVFDLSVPVLEAAEFDGCKMGVRQNAHARPVVAERSVEVVYVSSDEREDAEGEKLAFMGKGIEKGASYERNLGLDLDLGKMEVDRGAAGGRRYSRKEKGKAKLGQSFIGHSVEFELFSLEKRLQSIVPDFSFQLPQDTIQHDLNFFKEAMKQKEDEELKLIMEIERERERELEREREREREQELERERERERELQRERERELELEREREHEGRESERERERVQEEMNERMRQRDIEYRLNNRRKHARPLEKVDYREPLEKEQKALSVGIGIESENFPNPFSTALNILREKIMKKSSAQLIKWKPSKDRDHNVSMPFVPSLLDLSLKVLVDNAETIVSLKAVPDVLKRRLSNLLCDSRKMNAKALDLFVRGSPAEIYIKDCSWITEDQFQESFRIFDPSNLRVFKLDLCGQCVIGNIITKTLARPSSSLPGLGIISLRGACCLSDDALKLLVTLAPELRSINLGQCSLLTDVGINDLANALGSNLRELFIDDCNRINAMNIAPALKKFERMEVLSVAGIPNVCDGFVSDIITACGRNIKDLDLAGCEELTDFSMEIIGSNCSQLHALNIANLHKLTDLALLHLASGCRSIRKLKLCENNFSDEAIAAFLEVSGESLEELSLNHVRKVGFSTALSLAKCSKELLSLDLSWCRKVTNEALGLIVDSCLLLKVLKLFGCTQITDVFLNGHSNSLVRIIGLSSTSLLEHLYILEDDEVLLRYSELQGVDHQDV